MSIRRLVICFSLALMAVVLIGIPFRSQLSSQGTIQTPTVLAGRNVNMVSGTTLPGGDPWLQRQNEPSIAVSSRNPLHLLAGANDYRTVDMPSSEGELPGKNPVAMVGDAWLGVFMSYDGGESWTSTMLPGYPQDSNPNNPLKGFRAAADPVVRSGPNGIFYYSGIAFNRSTPSIGVIFVARFIDNNNTEGGNSIQYLDTKIIATGTATKFLDKPWIAVDQPRVPMTNITVAGQSIPRHNVYIAYSAFATSGSTTGDIMFARSADCGTTWGAPIKISTGNFAHQGAVIAIKPVLGEVLVAFRRFAQTKTTPDSIYIAQSLSRGLNFQSPIKVADIPPFDQPTTSPTQSLPGGTFGAAFRTNSYPTMTVDKSGHVYLAWSQRGVGPSGDARVMLSYSYLGSSWSTPQPVANTDENGLPFLGHQIMPSLSFGAGKLILVWYDQRHDVSADRYGYAYWIQDNLPYRHTMDVWTAVAETKNFPALAWKSTQVSRYLYSILQDESGQIVYRNGKPIIFPSQFNCVNYLLFKGGLNPFNGDYIDVAAAPSFRLDTWRNWIFNTDSSDSPVFHVAWTDNRDVRPPVNGDWTKYTPPISSQPDGFVTGGRLECGTSGDANAPGMRNQNIYTSRITWGIEAGSPTNHKQLDLTGGVARAFVVFIKNNTDSLRHYRLSITAQPVGGQASFLQLELLPSLDVDIAAFSTISRPVFIRSSDPNASVTINIDEIDASGSVVTGGLKSSVLINGDPTNPPTADGEETHNPNIVNQANPNIVNWYVNPNIVNPNIVNSTIVNPNIVNPNIVNPNIVNTDPSNPNIVNPNIVNPNIVNPNIVNHDVPNPNIVNPNIVNPNIVNTNIGDANPGNVSATDVEWTVKNEGTATTSYTLKTLAKKSPPEGVYVQLLVYRVHYTPAVAGAELAATGVDGCLLKQEPHHELVLNVVNPNIVNPNIVNPNIVNPNIVNSSVENATFAVAPGEEVIVDLRVLDSGIAKASSMAMAKAQSAGPALQASSALEFIDSLGFAVTSQAANSNDARQGIKVPPAAATALVIGTGSLPDGVVGAGYSAALLAYGGTGSYAWTLNSGELPPGLGLGAGGLITGVPTTVGTFYFVIRVDSGDQFDTQRYSITINQTSTPPPLQITTTSLPNGVQGTWYGVTLQATGGVWPRTWSLASGSLPSGLSLDSGGVISGTPAVVGTSTFKVGVTDGSGQSVTKDLGIAIAAFIGNSTISGTVRDGSGFPLDGVLLRGLPNTPTTGDDGTYSVTVPKGWSGTAIPFKVGYFFTPESRTYTSAQTQANIPMQDYSSSNWLVKEEWVARYNGPAQSSYDYAAGMAMDSHGNVYVTGSSDNGKSRYDYTTIKFSASGAQPLVASYNGPRYMDEASAIAIDPSDHIYVTGYSLGTTYPAFASDVVTIRYDSSLNEIWVVRYDSATTDVYPTAIGVDGVGNVYVTGENAGEGANATSDFITLKYDSSGVLQAGWPQTYHLDGSTLSPKGVAVDSDGNVYVTGTSWPVPVNGSTSTIVTVKYNNAGVLQWVRNFAGSAQGLDFPVGIVVQPSGVYVAGQTQSTGSYNDYLLIKYDSTGGVIWQRIYSNTPTSDDYAQVMAMRANGDIYLTGYSWGDYVAAVTIGYNAAGDIVWDKEDQYPQSPTGLAVDVAGHVYITGYGWDGKYFDEIQTAEYGPDGSLLWTMHDDAGRRGDDAPIGVAIAPSGDVVVCGNSMGDSTNNDFYGAQYHATNSGPQVQWRQTYSGPANDDYLGTIAIDPDGNVFATGWSYGIGTFSDYATVKYDTSGQAVWPGVAARYDKSAYLDNPYSMAAATVGGSRYVFVTGQSYIDTDSRFASEIATVKYDGATGGQLAEARHSGTSQGNSQAMASDSSGNIYVVGRIYVSGQGYRFLTIKYNASLVQQWEQAYNGPGSQDSRAIAATVDPAGNICVTGTCYAPGTNYDIATVKYDPSGNLLWEAKYNGPDGLSDQPRAIKTDAQGNVYVLGSSQGSATGTDFVTIKYDSSGHQVWAAPYNGPGNAADTPYSLAVDASGNAYVAGGSYGDRSFEDYVTIKYDTNGTQLWAARYDSNYSEHDAAEAVAVDSSGNVYVTGRSQGKTGHSDFVTVKYDSLGQLVWVIRYNGPGDASNYAVAIAVDANGFVYVGGQSEGAGTNGMDYAIVKYKQR